MALGPVDLVAMGIVAVGLLVVARPGMPKAYGLAFIALLVYGADVVAAWLGQPPTGASLGFVAADVAEGNRLWSPLTSIFAHADLGHLFGNLVILVTAGPALEDRIGERRFLVIFFTAGLVALVAHTMLAFLTPLVSPASIALGASGAIFGVLTAFAVRHPRERLPLLLGFFVIWIPAFGLLLVYLGFNLFYMFGLGPSNVAWWGHFAGFLVGLAFAYSIPAAERRGARGLPDAAKLEPLATTPELKRILDRIRQFTPETRTHDDVAYADAWLAKFFGEARCPTCGRPFVREGLAARCEGGETQVAFGRGA